MIDSHVHLTSPQLIDRAEILLEEATQEGITHLINITTDPLSLEKGLELQAKHKNLYTAAATTPHDVAHEGASFFPLVENSLSSLVALGETGLDYHYEHSSRDLQKKWFASYIELALKHKKPLIIHCRDAFSDLFAIISDLPPSSVLIHCFTGTQEEAKQAISLGCYLSFSGIVTFKKSTALQEVASYVPLDRILIETDAPYLSPEGYRNEQNKPAFLIHTAKKMALLRGISFDALCAATSQNALDFFRITT